MNHIIMQGARKIGDITIESDSHEMTIKHDLAEILGVEAWSLLQIQEIGNGYKVFDGYNHILDLVR